MGGGVMPEVTKDPRMIWVLGSLWMAALLPAVDRVRSRVIQMTSANESVTVAQVLPR
jgi:hypothetical protein